MEIVESTETYLDIHREAFIKAACSFLNITLYSAVCDAIAIIDGSVISIDFQKNPNCVFARRENGEIITLHISPDNSYIIVNTTFNTIFGKYVLSRMNREINGAVSYVDMILANPKCNHNIVVALDNRELQDYVRTQSDDDCRLPLFAKLVDGQHRMRDIESCIRKGLIRDANIGIKILHCENDVDIGKQIRLYNTRIEHSVEVLNIGQIREEILRLFVYSKLSNHLRRRCVMNLQEDINKRLDRLVRNYHKDGRKFVATFKIMMNRAKQEWTAEYLALNSRTRLNAIQQTIQESKYYLLLDESNSWLDDLSA